MSTDGSATAVFVYGSLMDPAVLRLVLGKESARRLRVVDAELVDAKGEKDSRGELRRVAVKGEIFPALTRTTTSCPFSFGETVIGGKLLLGLLAEDLRVLDWFEEEYDRVEVAVAVCLPRSIFCIRADSPASSYRKEQQLVGKTTAPALPVNKLSERGCFPPCAEAVEGLQRDGKESAMKGACHTEFDTSLHPCVSGVQVVAGEADGQGEPPLLLQYLQHLEEHAAFVDSDMNDISLAPYSHRIGASWSAFASSNEDIHFRSAAERGSKGTSLQDDKEDAFLSLPAQAYVWKPANAESLYLDRPWDFQRDYWPNRRNYLRMCWEARMDVTAEFNSLED